MAVSLNHVDGADRGGIRLYALSTCMWCRKTRELIEELGVAYDYVYVDLLKGPEQRETTDELKRWNPANTFPTLVIRGDHIIVGFRETEIRDALKG